MSYLADTSWSRERRWAAASAVALQVAILFLVLRANAVPARTPVADVQQVFLDITAPPPLVKPPEVKPKLAKAAGAASAPNLRATPSPVVAPKPIVPPLKPTPTAAPPRPSTGSDASAGASDRTGEGMGGGGQGDGSGSGDAGQGDGDGGDSPPRQIGGRIKRSDYPQEAGELDRELTVSVLFRVEPDGRVDSCRIARSSGRRVLDETVCRLIEQRFRFEPSRDSDGRPVPSTVDGDYSWAPSRN